MLIYFNVQFSWITIPLYVLPISLWVFSLYGYKRMDKLTTVIKDQKKTVQNLKETNTQLELKVTKAEFKVSQYHNLFENTGVLTFTIDLLKNMWILSNNQEDNYGKDVTDFQKSLLSFEKTIYEEDKLTYLIKKNQWLSGTSLSYEFRTVSENGQIEWKEIRTKSNISSSGTVEKITGIIMEITHHKARETNLEQMAFYDALTELPNRMMMKSHLQKALSRAHRKHHEIIIMFLDLDGFKAVNDTLGHDAGDQLLKDVATRLIACVREEDMVSRIGGDEFILVFEETNKNEVAEIAERILINISNPYYIFNSEVNVTPSMGISIYPYDGDDLDTLIAQADKAMYVAKNSGKSRFQFYTTELENYELPKKSLMEKFINLFQK